VYTIAVKRDFIARHYLVGGDWGAENLPHSHHYVLELQLEGQNLDQHGYLVDIVEIESALEEIMNIYGEILLNDLPAFNGLNPSLENFCTVIGQEISEKVHVGKLHAITVKLWENESAWASHRVEQ
jgi:6-pyruvoyltetrahydropterin/6-carboxytetrahydropterin synthase